MLDRDGPGSPFKPFSRAGAPKCHFRGFCKGAVLEVCKNFWNFCQKRGKNIVKFIVGSIPPGRGYQLMPYFEAWKGLKSGYFSGFG